MKIRSKILAGFMVVASVGVAIGTAGFVTTRMLSGIATELNAVQLESASISNVLNAHYVWRQRLTESVLSAEEFTGSLDPDTCALGTWYDSEEAQNMSDPELLSMLAAVDEPHSLIHTEAGDVAAYIEAGQLDEARRYLKEVILPKTEEVIGILTAMQARYSVLTEEKTAESVRIEEMVILVNAALIALAVVSGVFFAFFIANMVGKPLAPLTAFMNKAGGTGDLGLTHTEEELIDRYAVKEDELGQAIRGSVAFIRRTVEVSKALETITSGDLTAEILPLSDKDTMGNSLIKMLGSFNGMFQNIQASTAQVSIAAKQVANGAQSLAQGSTEQSATVDELSGFISAIAEKTRINADMSGKAAKLAETIKESAEKGSRQMDEMMRAVGDINDASKNIGRILKTIDDIAFRTNILALNASVEAARAGQHGVGFAVVAEEVRNLAAKSAEASKDSGLMVQNSIEKAALGSRIAGDTAASLAEIVSGINQSGAMIEEIAKMSEEQSQGITRINNGIDQVTQVVRQNSATAQESAAASEEMSGQSAMLEEMIAQFKLRDSGAAHQGASLSERFVIPGNSGFALSEVREGYGKY